MARITKSLYSPYKDKGYPHREHRAKNSRIRDYFFKRQDRIEKIQLEPSRQNIKQRLKQYG